MSLNKRQKQKKDNPRKKSSSVLANGPSKQLDRKKDHKSPLSKSPAMSRILASNVSLQMANEKSVAFERVIECVELALDESLPDPGRVPEPRDAGCEFALAGTRSDVRVAAGPLRPVAARATLIVSDSRSSSGFPKIMRETAEYSANLIEFAFDA